MKSWEELYTEPEKTDEEGLLVHCVEKIHKDKGLGAFFAKMKVEDTYNELCKQFNIKDVAAQERVKADEEAANEPEPETEASKPKSKKKKK